MDTPSKNIKDMLVAASALSLVAGTNLFIGREPIKPNNTVTILDTAGTGASLDFDKNDPNDPNDNDRYEYAEIQIRIRNTSYETGMNLARKIISLLHNRGNEVINQTKVTLIQSVDSPFLLDWDDNNRARIVTNFEVQQTEV